jgi:hypothetical protein
LQPALANKVHWKNPFIIQKADRCRSFDGCPPFLVSALLK